MARAPAVQLDDDGVTIAFRHCTLNMLLRWPE
jgi:hypothetical protein